jgi:hypothetical protein
MFTHLNEILAMRGQKSAAFAGIMDLDDDNAIVLFKPYA